MFHAARLTATNPSPISPPPTAPKALFTPTNSISLTQTLFNAHPSFNNQSGESPGVFKLVECLWRSEDEKEGKSAAGFHNKSHHKCQVNNSRTQFPPIDKLPDSRLSPSSPMVGLRRNPRRWDNHFIGSLFNLA